MNYKEAVEPIFIASVRNLIIRDCGIYIYACTVNIGKIQCNVCTNNFTYVLFLRDNFDIIYSKLYKLQIIMRFLTRQEGCTNININLY